MTIASVELSVRRPAIGCRAATRLALDSVVAAVRVDEDLGVVAIPGAGQCPRQPPSVKGATRRRADGLRPPLTPGG